MVNISVMGSSTNHKATTGEKAAAFAACGCEPYISSTPSESPRNILPASPINTLPMALWVGMPHKLKIRKAAVEPIKVIHRYWKVLSPLAPNKATKPIKLTMEIEPTRPSIPSSMFMAFTAPIRESTANG